MCETSGTCSIVKQSYILDRYSFVPKTFLPKKDVESKVTQPENPILKPFERNFLA